MKYKQGDKVRWTNSSDVYAEGLATAYGVVTGPLNSSEFDLDEVGQMYTVAIKDGDICVFESELERVL